jgi:hypothetical protein
MIRWSGRGRRPPKFGPRRFPPLLFVGRPVVLLASGPSLTADDVDYCRGRAGVVAINDNHRLAPWADVLYACDGQWWRHYEGVPEFGGQKWTQDADAASRYGLNYIQGYHRNGLSLDRGAIHYGGNSGFQALNLAVHMGARRIILLGFDMQLGADGKRHWFGNHPGKLNLQSTYEGWRDFFAKAVPDLARLGVEVINATRETALTCFPREPLRQALRKARR